MFWVYDLEVTFAIVGNAFKQYMDVLYYYAMQTGALIIITHDCSEYI